MIHNFQSTESWEDKASNLKDSMKAQVTNTQMKNIIFVLNFILLIAFKNMLLCKEY